jgi:hypothetical protein
MQGTMGSAPAPQPEIQSSASGCAVASFAKPLPNPSVEWTATGMALGPRAASGHPPSRGPSATPASAPSPQTLGRRCAPFVLEPSKHIEPRALEGQKIDRRAIARRIAGGAGE